MKSIKSAIAILIITLVTTSCSKNDDQPLPSAPIVTNVYEAGYYNNKATLWKNNIPISLSSDSGEAFSVFVAGNDVYIAGREFT